MGFDISEPLSADTADWTYDLINERPGELTGEDSFTQGGMITVHHKRRAFFRLHGATATVHGVPDTGTADQSKT
ncbi:hypothetical protein A9Q94_02080 [Rhodobacterales bacterium 56_14_T64]|nr:hypothetical protein A9Q94_02080 [Rhodobacterales bacterium 56_14_T64]